MGAIRTHPIKKERKAPIKIPLVLFTDRMVANCPMKLPQVYHTPSRMSRRRGRRAEIEDMRYEKKLYADGSKCADMSYWLSLYFFGVRPYLFWKMRWK